MAALAELEERRNNTKALERKVREASEEGEALRVRMRAMEAERTTFEESLRAHYVELQVQHERQVKATATAALEQQKASADAAMRAMAASHKQEVASREAARVALAAEHERKVAELRAQNEREACAHTAQVAQLERANDELRQQMEAEVEAHTKLAERDRANIAKLEEQVQRQADAHRAIVAKRDAKIQAVQAAAVEAAEVHAAVAAGLRTTIEEMKVAAASEAAAHAASLAERDASLESVQEKARSDAMASVGRLWSRTATSAVAVSERDASIDQLKADAESEAERARAAMDALTEDLAVYASRLVEREATIAALRTQVDAAQATMASRLHRSCARRQLLAVLGAWRMWAIEAIHERRIMAAAKAAVDAVAHGCGNGVSASAAEVGGVLKAAGPEAMAEPTPITEAVALSAPVSPGIAAAVAPPEALGAASSAATGSAPARVPLAQAQLAQAVAALPGSMQPLPNLLPQIDPSELATETHVTTLREEISKIRVKLAAVEEFEKLRSS